MEKRETTVKIPKAILFIAKVLEKLNNKAALNFALKLFYKPTRFPRPEREERIYRSAEKDFFFLDERKIRQYIWKGGEKKILFVHGWSGRGTQMSRLIEEYIKKGFTVYSFDAPGHGESDGVKTHMLEFVACIQELNRIHGGFDYIVGHSMGGVATMNAVDRGVKAKKISVIGTPNLIRNVVSDFCMNLNLGDNMVDMIIDYMYVRHGSDIENISSQNVGARIGIPILIIHDKNDVDVLYSEAENMHKALKNSQLFSTEGLGHRRILADQKVVERLLEFTQS